jgi:uncharacterized protein YegL
VAEQTDERFTVAPFILVVDRSQSMKPVMPTVNTFIPELIETMREIPEALESVALGIVSFNERARIVRHLTWIDEDITMPKFAAEHRTSYVEPLDQTRQLIEDDAPNLGERGFPPVVFFITDAQPNVESEAQWLAARSRLLNCRFRPKLVTFGFGDVNEATLRKLASDPKLAEFNDKAAKAAMSEILKIVMTTVIRLTAGGGKPSDGSLASRIIDSEANQDDDTIVYGQ